MYEKELFNYIIYSLDFTFKSITDASIGLPIQYYFKPKVKHYKRSFGL